MTATDATGASAGRRTRGAFHTRTSPSVATASAPPTLSAPAGAGHSTGQQGGTGRRRARRRTPPTPTEPRAPGSATGRRAPRGPSMERAAWPGVERPPTGPAGVSGTRNVATGGGRTPRERPPPLRIGLGRQGTRGGWASTRSAESRLEGTQTLEVEEDCTGRASPAKRRYDLTGQRRKPRRHHGRGAVRGTVVRRAHGVVHEEPRRAIGCVTGTHQVLQQPASSGKNGDAERKPTTRPPRSAT